MTPHYPLAKDTLLTDPLSPALRSAHAPSAYRGAFLLRHLQQDLPFSIHVFATHSALQLYADSPATPSSPLEPLGSLTYPDLHHAEAAVIEGLEVFVVSCPKDLTMFEDALKTSGYEGKFIVRELIELIDECMEYNVPEKEVFQEVHLVN